MKITFPLPTDNKRHRYCQNCYSENIHDVIADKKRLYKCHSCGKTFDRLIDIDPALKWWIDQKTGEYWHESASVFVIRSDEKILFVERTIYPYGFTVPSGHIEEKETPEYAARRELFEEAGIRTHKLIFFSTEDIVGDLCRRGADCHRHHFYILTLSGKPEIKTDREEGRRHTWMNINEALRKKLTAPTRYCLKKYGNKILEPIR
ncbi:MAG TPA: NUDIX hydrolase [Candidatus Bathyarchaeia archaeon]|nr:NUDIX hydrolase [Candidatus Bathyarchaeia archaeon]